MAKYIIEYKTYDYPYDYKPYGAPRDTPYHASVSFDRLVSARKKAIIPFDSLVSARKKAMALIKSHEAIVCEIRGGVEKKLVYITESGNFVSEDRDTKKWYHLNKDGTLGSVISNTKNLNIIQSHWKDGKRIFW